MQNRFTEVNGATVYGGWTIEFDICFSTQTVYVIVNFKSTISSLSRAHIAHHSTHTSCWVYTGVGGLFCLQANQPLNKIDIII